MRIDDGKARTSCFIPHRVRLVPTFRCAKCEQPKETAGRKRQRFGGWVCAQCAANAGGKACN